MISSILFYFSGAVIVLLIGAKAWETKRRRPFVLFQMISKGDERFRALSHDAAHYYSEGKEKGAFFMKKQLPMHTKNLLNKTETLAKEKADKYLGNIRNTRLLKNKDEGISEFFKNISIMEKETAEALEDTPQNLEADSQNPVNKVE